MHARPFPGFLNIAAILAGIIAPILAAILAGCDRPSKADGQATLATVKMNIGMKIFTLEVADTEAKRQKGLMRRDSLPKDQGMIFVFPKERQLSFWMKNTRIPLDIIYLDSKGKIVSIKQMRPYDIEGTPSDGPAQYAIELNQGVAKSMGIKAGQALELPEGLSAKD